MMFRFTPIRTSVSLCALIGFCTLAPLQAKAQGAAHHFTPLQGWTVGSTELASVRGLQDVKLPCVLSAEYDNGYIVRFSGGGNKMLALAIDFRQEVFTRGKKYAAMLSVGDGYVKQVGASAFTPGILIFNLRDLPDIYGVLKGAKDFSLDIDGNVFTFSLQQMAQNFGSLEACYATGNAAPIAPVVAQNDAMNAPQSIVPPAPVQQHALPRSFDDILTAEPDAPAAATQNAAVGMRRTDSVLPRSGSVSRALPATQKSATWTAQSGEDIRAVLSRWAGQAGYELQWQADNNGQVVQDIAVDGSFEQAVSQLLAENKAVTGISGRFDTGGMSAQPSSGSWSASAGSDLKSVLDQWAGRAGVTVVWESSAGMPPLRAPVQAQSFESAVQAVLDQYEGDLRRPVARLNTDPQTKKRTLLLDIDSAG